MLCRPQGRYASAWNSLRKVFFVTKTNIPCLSPGAVVNCVNHSLRGRPRGSRPFRLSSLSCGLCFLSTFILKCDSPGFLFWKIPVMSSMPRKKSCWQEKLWIRKGLLQVSQRRQLLQTCWGRDARPRISGQDHKGVTFNYGLGWVLSSFLCNSAMHTKGRARQTHIWVFYCLLCELRQTAWPLRTIFSDYEN